MLLFLLYTYRREGGREGEREGGKKRGREGGRKGRREEGRKAGKQKDNPYVTRKTGLPGQEKGVLLYGFLFFHMLDLFSQIKEYTSI